MYFCISKNLLDFEAVAVVLSRQSNCRVVGCLLQRLLPIDCCSSERVLVVLNATRFKMMQGLCAHDCKQYRSLSGSRLRFDF